MIDLYLAGTANGFRASVVLEEAGLPYRAHKVDLAKGEHRGAEFLKLNPAGLIPVIVDQDGPGGKPLTLSQSGAIILY
ncbi:MAG: glutathione S-transferase N-terminal domain-containing protein, partial [Chthoniobacteraceae bacterium]